jgi:hypothetical protein
MKAAIYPYKPGSESCKALAEGLDLIRIAHKDSKYKGSKDKLVINWGASKVPEEVSKSLLLNLPQAVQQASNKALAFRRMNEGRRQTRAVYAAGGNHELSIVHDIFKGVADDFVGEFAHPRYGKVIIKEPAPNELEYCRTPEYTTDFNTARHWLAAGFTVVERHVLNGHSGEGIRLVEPEAGEEIQKAPLYVKYIPKKQEYRIHVCGGIAVDIQRKARRKDVADDAINWKIRNHGNGFVFARNEDGQVPIDVLDQSVRAIKSLGLAFGAVDVIFNDKLQQAFVLEVNTAPGLQGETLNGYVGRFKDYLSGAIAIPNQLIPKDFIGEDADPADPFAAPVAFAPPPQPQLFAGIGGKPRKAAAKVQIVVDDDHVDDDDGEF